MVAGGLVSFNVGKRAAAAKGRDRGNTREERKPKKKVDGRDICLAGFVFLKRRLCLGVSVCTLRA